MNTVRDCVAAARRAQSPPSESLCQALEDRARVFVLLRNGALVTLNVVQTQRNRTLCVLLQNMGSEDIG